jgi:methanethiol S-methyltransferase
MATRIFVWTGGAMFVMSLALCTWWYLVVFARASPFAGWRPVVVDALLFSCFALHHSVFARDRLKRAVAAVMPERLTRSFYVWTASLLLIVVCMLWQPVGGELYEAHGVRAIAHAALQLVGIAVIVQSVRAIDALDLAGIRQIATLGNSSRLLTRSGPDSATVDILQTRGPYRWVRHPLYLGWMLAVFGAAHMTGDRAVFAAITSFYLVIAIPWEERSLARAFAREYETYRRQVRWRVIPFVY